jgi:flavodoxin I
MKTLVVYDSVYGNTERIARAIGEAITGEVKVVHASEVSPSESETFSLLIVGSPTHAGRPTQAVQDFLRKAPALRDTPVAAFDTRLSTRLAKIFGYAAGRIGKTLEKKGGILIKPPEAFFVEGTKGPLREGELERAASWAKEIVDRMR